MTAPPPELSIIIPAFNEELRLPRSLERIHDYLHARGITAEVLVVDDGSTDGTAELVRELTGCYPELRLLSHSPNRGKGFSVRQGMLAARGKVALFTDSDLSAPIEEADKLLEALRRPDCDAAIGSRAMDRRLIAARQSPFREWAGICFNRFVRWMTGAAFADTQCGFKAFRRERFRAVFEQQRIRGFGFDPEVLFLARRHGLRVVEVPVRWAHDPATKVHVLADGARMCVDLLTIRWHACRGRYPKVGTS